MARTSASANAKGGTGGKAPDVKTPDLARLKRLFQEARDLTAQARLDALIDQDYYDSICAAAMACQGFCRSELSMFRQLLGPGVEVERTEHLLGGARRCAYRIQTRK